MSIHKSVCPKCNRQLLPAGEVSVDGHQEIVYQCDECTETVELFGEMTEVALTFSVQETRPEPEAD